ncbi:MAG: gamma-glutamyl phosphate reductase [Deltaproteobacteria bacterium]|nr:MAG: gamma-glutamyl phosphate reductase [Deltaproteobacteria bacterium]
MQRHPPGGGMTALVQRAPRQAEIGLADLVDEARRFSARRPFDEDSLALCARVGRLLLDLPASRSWPELVALGYWLRPAALQHLADDFAALQAADPCWFQPRGLALHLPPRNVGTIAIHSWALSVLAGNGNIVRVSPRRTALSDALIGVLQQALADAPAELSFANRFVEWGHDREVLAALSSVARVRLIWGGDATVQELRAVPLPPRSIDLCFSDRWSAAILSADAFRALDEEGLDDLAHRFFNDAWWFDQRGCASPRLLAWVGEDTAPCTDELVARAASIARRRGWRPDAALAVERLGFATSAALDLPGVSAGYRAAEAEVLRLSSLRGLPRVHCGGGFFFHVELRSLAELVPHLQVRDQTLTWFGFSPEVLRTFVAALADRGVDRIVPMGHALRFSRYWDGHDLLQALTRRVHLVEHP